MGIGLGRDRTKNILSLIFIWIPLQVLIAFLLIEYLTYGKYIVLGYIFFRITNLTDALNGDMFKIECKLSDIYHKFEQFIDFELEEIEREILELSEKLDSLKDTIDEEGILFGNTLNYDEIIWHRITALNRKLSNINYILDERDISPSAWRDSYNNFLQVADDLKNEIEKVEELYADIVRSFRHKLEQP